MLAGVAPVAAGGSEMGAYRDGFRAGFRAGARAKALQVAADLHQKGWDLEGEIVSSTSATMDAAMAESLEMERARNLGSRVLESEQGGVR